MRLQSSTRDFVHGVVFIPDGIEGPTHWEASRNSEVVTIANLGLGHQFLDLGF